MSEANKGLKPSPASESYVCYSKNDVLLVLSAGEIDLNELDVPESTVLVYAETVTLSKDILAPGKTLGIFCWELKASGPTPCTINVSGRNARDMSASPSGNGKAGETGDNGGNIWLYVENTDISSIGLKVKADGGNGGRGGDTLDATATGGNGGNGGDAGTISIAYRDPAVDLIATLRGLRDQSWVRRTEVVHGAFLPGCDAFPPGCIDPAQLDALKDTVTLHRRYATSVQQLARILPITKPHFNNGDEWQAVEVCLDAIRSLMGSGDFPEVLDESHVSSVDSLTTSIVQWGAAATEGPDGKKSEILGQIWQLTEIVARTSDDSTFATRLHSVTDDLRAAIIRLEVATTRDIPSALGGSYGAGGVGKFPDSSTGKPGQAGKDGSRTSLVLTPERDSAYLNLSQACVFPEHAQMILNEADQFFFLNTPESRPKAAALYTRLLSRLSFVPKLGDTAQAKAYDRLEKEQKLTVAALSQLESVFSQARTRQARILAGQDIFGRDPSWVPRLSTKVYAQRADKLLVALKGVEDMTSGYQEALKNDGKVEQYLKSSLKAGKDNEEHLKSLLDSQCGPDGAISAAAAQVTKFAQLQSEKREEIKGPLERVKDEIGRASQIDFWKVFEGLSNLVQPPSFQTAVDVAKIGKIAWDVYKTVQDETGASFDKADIIERLATCSDTLKSLEQAVTMNEDGKINLEDPGGLKIIAAVDDIKSLVKHFKDALLTKTKDLDKILDDYVKLVLQRNSAVLAFNGAVQVAAEAVTQLAAYRKQNPQLAEQLLELDPNLPSIFFWMTRLRDTLRMDIMQQLNYQGRAICFWGPRGPIPFTEAGPLRGYTQLLGNQQTLEREFQACVERFASSTWSSWPAKDGDPGLRYELSAAESMALLQNPKKDSKGRRMYETIVAFAPTRHTETFAGMANIRLNQVRVWLLGARRKAETGGHRQILQVSISHLGHETLWDPNANNYTFNHEPVDLQFSYDTSKVDAIDDCLPSLVFGRQAIENDYVSGDVSNHTVAPIGPLGEWTIQIREGDNEGLDLSRVTGVWMEFCGRNMPFHSPEDPAKAKN